MADVVFIKRKRGERGKREEVEVEEEEEEEVVIGEVQRRDSWGKNLLNFCLQYPSCPFTTPHRNLF